MRDPPLTVGIDSGEDRQSSISDRKKPVKVPGRVAGAARWIGHTDNSATHLEYRVDTHERQYRNARSCR
jgi:hypothetical protein